ncbi:MAG TPA: hypothetical protein VD835_13535 [Pyrinomonadaceae bacterium]|nr:hypothetical protein [Pyrinomonadaceae bacterium]
MIGVAGVPPCYVPDGVSLFALPLTGMGGTPATLAYHLDQVLLQTER